MRDLLAGTARISTMAVGFKPVSGDGPSSFYGDWHSATVDRLYELKALPWSTRRMDPSQLEFGQKGYHFATSRACAMEFAREQDCILLTVEGVPAVEKSELVVCNQLTVMSARRCFCHPAQLTDAQAIALAVSIAELVAHRSGCDGVREALVAAMRFGMDATPVNAALALAGASSAASLSEESETMDAKCAASAAAAAALAAVASAAPDYQGTYLGSEFVQGSETSARRAGLSVVPVARTVGNRVKDATRQCSMATNVIVQLREGMGSELARAKGIRAGDLIWGAIRRVGRYPLRWRISRGLQGDEAHQPRSR